MWNYLRNYQRKLVYYIFKFRKYLSFKHVEGLALCSVEYMKIKVGLGKKNVGRSYFHMEDPRGIQDEDIILRLDLDSFRQVITLKRTYKWS